MTKITRPALRYHGSKFRLRQWIISHFPIHDCYVEPYGGGAAVLLQKPRSYLEVYNDKDSEVVNYFQILRQQPHELARVIKLTPYAKAEWELSHRRNDDPDPLERARRLYVKAYMNIAGPTAQWNSGWRRQKIITKKKNKKEMTPAPITFMKTDHLLIIAQRLRGVQIECDEALAVIKRYDSPQTLFYIDPPYPESTRKKWKKSAYQHEMTDRQHTELATTLHNVQGMVIISGYRCPLFNRLYPWYRTDRTARVNGPGQATESLWISPAAMNARQRSLFTLTDAGRKTTFLHSSPASRPALTLA